MTPQEKQRIDDYLNWVEIEKVDVDKYLADLERQTSWRYLIVRQFLPILLILITFWLVNYLVGLAH